jgi:DNA-binding response OmpR family regulator
MPSLTVLLAETEPIISMEIRQILEDQGYQVVQATDLNDLKNACAQHQPALAILNFKSKGNGDGMWMAHWLTKTYMLPIILVTGAQPHEIKTSPYFNDRLGILYKPFTPSQVRRLVQLAASAPA